MDCNSLRFRCLQCLMIRAMTPQRAKLAMTAAIITPAAVAGCEKSLEICKVYSVTRIVATYGGLRPDGDSLSEV